MSQSKIFVDIGNSAVKWRTIESNVYSKSVDEFLLNTLPQADTAWVSAVANSHIVEDIEDHFDTVHLVNSQNKFNNLKIFYDDSSNLGSDRFFAMIGAMEHFPNNALLIIDIGSAMTFDVIDGSGLHQGGLIMPGLGVLRRVFQSSKRQIYQLILMVWRATQQMHGKAEHNRCSCHQPIVKLKNLMKFIQME